MGVLKGRLGPHADSPSSSGCFDDAVVWLGGTFTVKVEDLSDRVGTLQDFNLRLGGTLSGVLGPPDDLDALDVVGDGEGLDGTESTLRDCTLHGVLGVGVPDVLCEVGKFLRALEGRDFGTEDGGEFVASCRGDLQGLLSLGEGKHGLEGCL